VGGGWGGICSIKGGDRKYPATFGSDPLPCQGSCSSHKKTEKNRSQRTGGKEQYPRGKGGRSSRRPYASERKEKKANENTDGCLGNCSEHRGKETGPAVI